MYMDLTLFNTGIHYTILTNDVILQLIDAT